MHFPMNRFYAVFLMDPTDPKRKLTDYGSKKVLTKKTSKETQFTLKESLKAVPRFSKPHYVNKLLPFFC